MSAVAPFPRSTYSYRTPGVYFEWLERPAVVQEVRTDVAGFVGLAERGPLHTPVRLESWAEFTSTFGRHIPQAYLAYAVEGFFENGGRTCWVVRAADPATAARALLELVDDTGAGTLRLEARTPGSWGNRVTAAVVRTAPSRFSLEVGDDLGAREIWRNLTMAAGDPRYAPLVLNDARTGSKLVEASDLGSAAAFPASTPNSRGAGLRFGVGRLAGGADGLAGLLSQHLSGAASPPDAPQGLAALEAVDEVAIVAMPDLTPPLRLELPPRPQPAPACEDVESPPLPPPLPQTPPEWPQPFGEAATGELQQALVRHCEKLKDRIALLDARPLDTTPELVEDLARGFDTSYAALYYPWVRMPDPLRLAGLLRAVPPSGCVAGVCARVDLRSGVHKPPANEPVEAVKALVVDTGDIAHGDLNERGVNVIRAVPGRGIRVLGARTLSSETPWRYLNVRRLLLMIEKAIDRGTQWSVFEPNGDSLWRDVDRVVRAFLDGLWRRGMLDGAAPAEAYLVRCDASTNPPEERDAGRMTCLVGVLPPWPAEFVVVRIGRTEGGTEISESVGGRDA